VCYRFIFSLHVRGLIIGEKKTIFHPCGFMVGIRERAGRLLSEVLARFTLVSYTTFKTLVQICFFSKMPNVEIVILPWAETSLTLDYFVKKSLIQTQNTLKQTITK
jgi:hypothetical protein